jgi:hypothetical protein
MGLRDEARRRQYFSDLWDWFLKENGASHIAAYLTERDISGFSASNGQRKTEAHRTVVAGGMQGDHWLEDILDEMDEPMAVRADWLINRAVAKGEKDGDVKRKLANTIGRFGYQMYKCPTTKDGRWRIAGKKSVVYVKAGVPESFDPAAELTSEPF